jgi:group I intron endonuclease
MKPIAPTTKYPQIQSGTRKGLHMAYIYVVTNTVNGMQYVGCSVRSMRGRWKTVLGGSYNRPIRAAIREFGFENFQCEVIEEWPDDDRFERATHWIKELNTLVPNGYNRRSEDVNNRARSKKMEELYG